MKTGNLRQVAAATTETREITVIGIVHGVGFRPFVVRLADRLRLSGWVCNDAKGVTIRVAGPAARLNEFERALVSERPPLSRVWSIKSRTVDETVPEGFAINASSRDGTRSMAIALDAGSCDLCLGEVMDPRNRRHRYAMTTCTDCGPRYSIAWDIPFDRDVTTMADFPMCDACRAEYEDRTSRRFHAQTIACPNCGPQPVLRDLAGRQAQRHGAASIRKARAVLRDGGVVAVKGIGGFHLMTDARRPEAVLSLRWRKRRGNKPFALMARDLKAVSTIADPSPGELALLQSVERPIVLLHRSRPFAAGEAVAPGLANLGVMLPLTPLHALLLDEDLDLVVATSANVSGDAILSDCDQLQAALAEGDTPFADAILDHDRAIRIGVDDTVLRHVPTNAVDATAMSDALAMAERGTVMLRAGRGYAPQVVELPGIESGPNIVAFGSDLKNTRAFLRMGQVVISPHIGNMDSDRVRDFAERTDSHFHSLLDLSPDWGACDLHPEYETTVLAQAAGLQHLVRVQHHHAHLASCLAENGCGGSALGIILDGFGLGWDGQAWGGELLMGGYTACRRLGRLRPTRMPGNDQAAIDCRRMAISCLVDACGDLQTVADLAVVDGLARLERQGYARLLRPRVADSPFALPTSSAGRLFDAIAALTGICLTNSYEGEAATRLEASAVSALGARNAEIPEGYCFGLQEQAGLWEIDPRPVVRAIVMDLRAGRSGAQIALDFHYGLADAVLQLVTRVDATANLPRLVALSGGVFANALLLTRLSQGLQQRGYEVLRQTRLPTGDGGISLGQVAVAAHCHKGNLRQPNYQN